MKFPSLISVSLSSIALCIAGAASAQNFPDKPIRIIVPYAPGGVDLQIRAMAPALTEALGQPIVVENRDGAGAVIGTVAVKNAPADGYTLLFTGTAALAVLPHMKKNLRFTMEDFAPIGNVTGTPLVLAARADAPYKNISEFLAYAKANPGKVNMGSSGTGTSTHIVGEAFQVVTNTKFTHVPYKGVSIAVQNMLGGFSDIVFGVPGAVAPHVASGKIRILATLDKKRSTYFADAPSTIESGVNLIEVTKFGLFAPAATPPEIQRKLADAVKRATENAEFKDAMAKSNSDVLYLNQADFRAALQEESKHWETLLKNPRFDEVVEK